MSPDINVAGDANIGGDLVGRDKQTRVSDAGPSEREWEQLTIVVGKLQSDLVNVRTELVAIKERLTFLVFGGIGLIVLSGVLVLVAAIAIVK